ncbi:hypothetical protein, partial [Sulfurovum sp. bin170]|uniref:hypothetical protein n=1 Tax=Sulfurovum sp. bin170 TaxID=2695268 RepID=UPI001CB71990
WFLSKRAKDRDQSRVKLLSNIIMEKESVVTDLESACVERKNQLNRLIDEGIVCRHQLLQKSNFLRKKSDELYRVQKRLEEVKSKEILEKPKEKNSNDNLFEEIKKMGNTIEEKDKTIAILKSRVEESKDDNYIHISKDQFNQIEKRLKEYKSRADMLENENSKLLVLRRLRKESGFLEDINLYISNIKEATLSNFLKKRAEA